MRLFVGVSLPDRLIEHLSTIRTKHPGVSRGRLMWEPGARMHATLRFIGDESPEVAIAALESVAPQEPFECVLGPQTGRFGNSLLHVPIFGLDELASKIVSATRMVGVAPETRPFTGHVTLARVKGGYLPADDVEVGLASEELTFEVDKYTLFKSEREGSETVYTSIQTFPLSKTGSSSGTGLE